MSRRFVTNPLKEIPTMLLEMIESDPQAFEEGRRNNDMVNWFVTKRLVDIREGLTFSSPRAMEDHYIAEFEDNVLSRLDRSRHDGLIYWSDKWETKIGRLCTTYGSYLSPQYLAQNVWIMMDYAPAVHEGQAQLAGLD